MKTFLIDWNALEIAFFERPDFYMGLEEPGYFFDKEKGGVVVVDDINRDLDPEELTEVELLAMRLEPEESTERLESIPKMGLRERRQMLATFIKTIPEKEKREQLSRILKQRIAISRIIEEISINLRWQSDLQVFESAERRKIMIEWLHGIDVEPSNPSESLFVAPELINLRRILLEEALRFVGLAKVIPGVKRVALIGSLTREKEFPKDLDLLVTVSDECDIKQVADLGRKLQGQLTKHSIGADVFLASPCDEYLGRTCPWKKCSPGIRADCHADRCGARPYLYNDLSVVRLNKSLLKNPPVNLWPKAIAAADVPADVHQYLIEPLNAADKI